MMKELSKEDQERIEKAAINHGDRYRMENACEDDFEYGAKYEHPIAFEKGKIEGFNEGYESRQSELEYAKANLFNEGIEAVKMLFNPMFEIHPDSRNIIMIIESLKKAFEEIDKLKKKVSNEKGTV